MERPALEVSDILRDHGPAWREANKEHVSLGQMKVMSAIKRCRTAALGGHVARCQNGACGHTVIAYNSCRNRHCPKCQGAAAREWLAEREAELLAVPYFHVVYTLPREIADIAYQNKAVIYDLLRNNTPASGRSHRLHVGAAHVGLGTDASSACPHGGAGRWSVTRRVQVDNVPTGLLSVRRGSFGAVPVAVPGDACGGSSDNCCCSAIDARQRRVALASLDQPCELVVLCAAAWDGRNGSWPCDSALEGVSAGRDRRDALQGDCFEHIFPISVCKAT